MLIETPENETIATAARAGEAFPPQVEMILSSMEVGRHAWLREVDSSPLAGEERRTGERLLHRVRAELRLFRDRPGTPAWLLYVRDADPRGLGFVSPHRLPLGYAGYVELVAPNGRPVSIHCTLLRCREAVKGWYEGAMSFSREQADFKI